ncbi:MAG: UDP-3-O-(3-hydroxymyristoyl)glucosamine N-acyltransferase [Syntrophorhabdaceae bacterium]|nr:UDP-3-O-(3-hydroxymyristoyl)glucosamine N-acyltransferase [Syntrophorhabdaceae bacterium]
MITLKEIAKLVDGRLIGLEDTVLLGISSIENAKKGDITFLIHKGYERYLDRCEATAVVVGKDIDTEKFKDKAFIVVENPGLAYIKIAEIFEKNKRYKSGISPLAFVSEDVDISKEASVLPFAFIGKGVRIGKKTVIHPFVHIGDHSYIGDDTVIYPGVTIYDNVSIGNRVIIHAGTVIGSDGFGYMWDGKCHRKIPQLGTVVIEDDVEIGANVTIDRASLDKTIIKKGTKIDNLVQIAHNVTVGENSIIVAQVGIAGSTKIGKHVVLAGQVGVKDHVVVGDNVRAGGQTGITKDVRPGSTISGTPHMVHKEWLKQQVLLKKLPELFERVKLLEERLTSGESK